MPLVSFYPSGAPSGPDPGPSGLSRMDRPTHSGRAWLLPLDVGPDRGLSLLHHNSVRILSRVAEGRALRRHSNRSTIAVDAGANSFPARSRRERAGGAVGKDKMVCGGRPSGRRHRPPLSPPRSAFLTGPP